MVVASSRVSKSSPEKILSGQVLYPRLHRQGEALSRSQLCFSLTIRTEHMGDAIRLWQHHDWWDRIRNLVAKVQYRTRKRRKFLSRTNSVANLGLNYFRVEPVIELLIAKKNQP